MLNSDQFKKCWKGTTMASDRITGMQPDQNDSKSLPFVKPTPFGTKQKLHSPMRLRYSTTGVIWPPMLAPGCVAKLRICLRVSAALEVANGGPATVRS
ncbi:unnamed protein product [Prorocentrum cordatum]|uniref:Uncharacterized protein n=1 Tax=Prorocentrum cordatum TaxID=2364126 RepID=A0ABN9VIG9_9DINO|nr:unnamed protein product [Polarella glacialis]